ncbi:hypothetical protein R3P38DRAFT_3195908 [Favolaschia claudopus]|uniref:Uncharacterized protein n=1 Tax=Favolaschia claudopus TaxID=2862362 RepID=A0AAW0B918_9AGAR
MSHQPTDPSLQSLAAVLTPDVFRQFKPILTNIAERLSNNKNTTTDLRREAATQDSLITAFREVLSKATYCTNNLGSSGGCASSFCVDLAYFRGTTHENFRAWYSMVKDQLRAAQIPRENWSVTSSGLLRDNTQTWYLATKQSICGGTPAIILIAALAGDERQHS